jgi:DNA-directed RNA polymerase omega subunit
MLNPAIGKLINNCDNRYQLVNQIAKNARKVSESYEEKGEILTEKAVTIAINEMAKDIEE